MSSEFKISHRGLFLCFLTSFGLFVLLSIFTTFAIWPTTLSLLTPVVGDAMTARIQTLSSGFAILLIFPTLYAFVGIIVYLVTPKETIDNIDERSTIFLLMCFASLINSFLWTFLLVAIPCGILLTAGNPLTVCYAAIFVTVVAILTGKNNPKRVIEQYGTRVTSLFISTYLVVEKQELFLGLIAFGASVFLIAGTIVAVKGFWTMMTRAYASFIMAATLDREQGDVTDTGTPE